MRKVVLVDGHHMLHRVCFIPELQALKRSDGFPTGPVFGFLRVLRATLDRFTADTCVVCWDTPGTSDVPGRRDTIYPEYKANRADKEKPEALQHLGQQLEMLFNILPYLNVKQLGIPGFEGDDMIYLLVKHLSLEDFEPIVVSDDKDLLQLVREGAAVYRPIADQLVNYANFEEMTGTHPEAFVLRKAIVGDTSDNIKGVQGVGEKTADKLLREAYQNEAGDWVVDSLMLEEDYTPLKDLCENHKTKTAQKVTDQWDVVERNLKLMDLRKNVFGSYLSSKADIVIAAPGNMGFTDVELIQELGKYEFNKIMEQFATWITPFRRLR